MTLTEKKNTTLRLLARSINSSIGSKCQNVYITSSSRAKYVNLPTLSLVRKVILNDQSGCSTTKDVMNAANQQ